MDGSVSGCSFLGNHILPDEDLAAFHWSLLGPEHPLASLKVPHSALPLSRSQMALSSRILQQVAPSLNRGGIVLQSDKNILCHYFKTL